VCSYRILFVSGLSVPFSVCVQGMEGERGQPGDAGPVGKPVSEVSIA